MNPETLDRWTNDVINEVFIAVMESRPLAQERYEADVNLKQVPFAEAEQALGTVVGLIERQGIFPLRFPTN